VKVPAQKLRWAVGSILAEGSEKPNEELVKLFEGHGFKLFNFPAVQQVVHTTFPYKTSLSIYIYIYRVYTAVGNYMEVSAFTICLVLLNSKFGYWYFTKILFALFYRSANV